MAALKNVSTNDISPQFRDLTKDCLNLPSHHTLGIFWDTDKDTLIARVDIVPKPKTKRGVLSMLSQVFDLLGVFSPFSLTARV